MCACFLLPSAAALLLITICARRCRPAAASGKRLFLLPTETGNEEQEAATEQALAQCVAAAAPGGGIEEGQLVSWQRQKGDGGSGEAAVVLHKFAIKSVTWHARGDYFATVAPTGNTQVGGLGG